MKCKRTMDEPMHGAVLSTMRDVPIDLSALFCLYVQVGNTARKSYKAVVVDAQIGSVPPNMAELVNRCHLTTMHSGGLFLLVNL